MCASCRPQLDQLIGRTTDVSYTAAARSGVRGRRVLVTGAGGSIGGELVRQLHQLDPAAVYLLDHDEGALHAMQLELHGHGLLTDERIILADIRDYEALYREFQRVRPEVVFHAAAHKHLPLLERYPAEGVKTNVLGTANVLLAAEATGVGAVVNISTDKAAAPSSVLGATKRVAEMLTALRSGNEMKVASVRFGNVLGSRGSFLPTLDWQVRHGLPVTITDPDVTRFFMTIPQAAALVIEAAQMADNGETYVLDMGEPVRIVDLVDRYAATVGQPAPRIVYTGLRPGEKLHEELVDGGERRRATDHPHIWCTVARQPLDPDLQAQSDQLADLADSRDEGQLRAALWSMLPDAVVDAEMVRA